MSDQEQDRLKWSKDGQQGDDDVRIRRVQLNNLYEKGVPTSLDR